MREGGRRCNYETKIGHEPQSLISASLMTHAAVKWRWFVFVRGPKPKCQHSSELPCAASAKSPWQGTVNNRIRRATRMHTRYYSKDS